MHYSSAALSFMLKNLTGPVVFVGAQRSSDRPSTDSALNLTCALKFVAEADVGEVGVCMHGTPSDTFCLIHRGVTVRKMHTSRRDAFRSINAKPLARVTPEKIEMLRQDYRRRSNGPVEVDDKLEERVAMVYVWPGLKGGLIDFLVEQGYKGIVLVGTGLGHAPHRVFPSIKKAIKDGVAVVMTSQCLFGRVNMNVYSTGRELLAMGVISGDSMLPEVAAVKLMWVLGHTTDPEEVKRLMLTNIAGELIPSISMSTFNKQGLEGEEGRRV